MFNALRKKRTEVLFDFERDLIQVLPAEPNNGNPIDIFTLI